MKIKAWWNEKGRSVAKANLQKARNWWKCRGSAKLLSVSQKFFSSCWRGLCEILRQEIRWGAIIACLLIAFMGDHGMLEQWPAIDWMAEVTLRALDWLVGLMRSFLQWFVDGSEFLLPEKFVEWFKYIFALS